MANLLIDRYLISKGGSAQLSKQSVATQVTIKLGAIDMSTYNKTEYSVDAVRVSTLKQRMSGDSPEDQKIQIDRHRKIVATALNSNIINI